MPTFALAALVALESAMPSALPSLAPAMMHIAMPSFTAQQRTISVKQNAPFQIVLRVNSGTGYTWRPRGPMPNGIALLGVFTQARGRMMPGGPGQEVLVFRAAAKGVYSLSIDYVRPWERNAKPASVHTVSVRVH